MVQLQQMQQQLLLMLLLRRSQTSVGPLSCFSN
jgi:hypothetical protein